MWPFRKKERQQQDNYHDNDVDSIDHSRYSRQYGNGRGGNLQFTSRDHFPPTLPDQEWYERNGANRRMRSSYYDRTINDLMELIEESDQEGVEFSAEMAEQFVDMIRRRQQLQYEAVELAKTMAQHLETFANTLSVNPDAVPLTGFVPTAVQLDSLIFRLLGMAQGIQMAQGFTTAFWQFVEDVGEIPEEPVPARRRRGR